MKKLLLLLLLISSTCYAESDVDSRSIIEGGSTIVGGTDGEVIYNNGNVLGGEAALFYNDDTNTFRLGGTTGTHISGDSQVLSFQGAGGSNNEKLTLDLESNANRVRISSDTAVVTIDLVAMNLTSTATGNFGWSVVTAANQACNATCANACVFGEDTAVVGTIVSCEDATGDVCVCSGQN